MTKKFLSILLSAVLVLSTMSTVFAADEVKAEFSSRLENTFARLAEENKSAARYDDSTAIIESLSKGAYEYNMSAKVDMPELFGSVSFENDFNGIPNESKFLNNIFVLLDMADSKPVKIDFSIYGDDDKLAFNFPGLFEEYYFLNKSDYRKWDNTEQAELLGINSEMLKMFDGYFQTMNFKTDELSNYQVPEGFTEPYAALFNEFLGKGTYRAEGSKTVASARGNLDAQKYTFTLRGTAVDSFKTRLITLVESDPALRDLLDTVYSSMPEMEPGVTMTDLVIEQFCDAIDSIDFGDYLKYSIYVGKNGYILSHEFLCGYDNADEQYFLKINTTGKSYLLNDVKISAGVISAEAGTMSVDFTVTGSNIGTDGIFNSDYRLSVNTFGENMNVLSGNLYYDATKSADNFKFTAVFDEDGMLGFPGDLSCSGDIEINKAKSLILYNLKDIKLNVEELTIPMSFIIKFAPVDPSVVDVQKDSLVNVMEMSPEDMESLGEKIETLFEGL